MAICSPEKNFISIEATRKKIDFQKEIVQELQINNHTAIWGRAEELGHVSMNRQQYDLVIARALAATDILAELTLPFVKINGFAKDDPLSEVIMWTSLIRVDAIAFYS